MGSTGPTWYYGDVLTTGNTVMQQGLAVLGTTWTPNVLSTQGVGTGAAPFATLVVSNANVTVANVLSFASGLGINVSSARGATLNVLGNVTVSNALSSNILSARVNTGTLNVLSVASPVALNTTSASGTGLYVLGNVQVSNSFGAGNLISNLYTVLANVGSGTVAIPSAPFVIAGNALVTNSIVTSNLVIPVSMNLTLANILSVPGPVGLGGNPSLATLNVTGNFLASNTLGGSNVLANLVNVSVTFGTQNLVSQQGGFGGTGVGGGALNISGNVQVSNLFQVPNIFTNFLNVGTSNLTSLVAVQVGLGLGALNVTGNVQVSNALQVPNVVPTSTTNVSKVSVASLEGLLNAGIGTSNGLPNVWVSGNVLVSNSLTGPLFFASAANVNQANVQTLVTGLWDAGIVTGNVQVSDTVITANIITTGPTSNTQTLNITGGLSVLSLGLGATPRANLQVSGNVSFGTFTNTGALSALGRLTYTEDLVRRAPHLVPSLSNAVQIQAWIRASSNLSRSGGGFSTLVASSPVSGYWGSVLCPSGQVILVPATANKVGIWNPRTNLLTLGADTITGFRGGVLDPTGNVILVPWTSTSVGIFCPATLRTTLVPTGLVSPGFDGGCLVPSGNVMFFPYSSGGLPGQYNPVTQTFSLQGPGFTARQIHGGTLTPTGQIVFSPGVSGTIFGLDSASMIVTTWGPVRGIGQDSFMGSVLDPLGNVVFVPYMSGNVTTFSPSAGTWSNVQATADGLGSWSGGVLGPTGNIMFFPNGSSNIGIFDPVALTFSNGAASASGYVGGSLLVNGTLVMCPGPNAPGVGVSSYLGAKSTQEFCTSPYMNKGP